MADVAHYGEFNAPQYHCAGASLPKLCNSDQVRPELCCASGITRASHDSPDFCLRQIGINLCENSVQTALSFRFAYVKNMKLYHR
jgi:hypothetical protein